MEVPDVVQLPSVRRLPIAVESTWSSQHYVTRTPIAGSFDVWRAEFRFSCEAEVLLALVVRSVDELSFGRLHRVHASKDPSATLSFLPFDWHQSDIVEVVLSYGDAASARMSVVDHRLKIDPRRHVWTRATEFSTGTVATLGRCERLGLSADVIAVAKSDTIATHGRWRLSDEVVADLPVEYSFLRSGSVSGRTSRSPSS